jgi:hypothetical protein
VEAAWLALAEEQDWLDGERSPVDPPEKNIREMIMQEGAHRFA